MESDPTLPHSIIPLNFVQHDESLTAKISALNASEAQMNEIIDVERSWIKKMYEHK